MKLEAPKAGTALVLASFYQSEMSANTKFIDQQGITLVTRSTRERNTGVSGYEEGKSFGSTLSLEKRNQIAGQLK